VEQSADQEADRGGPEADQDHLDPLLAPIADQGTAVLFSRSAASYRPTAAAPSPQPISGGQ